MRPIKLSTAVFLLLTALVWGPAISFAQTLEDAIENYREGDYKKAIRQWGELAEGGDADANYNLGQVFKEGNGVSFDYPRAEAHYRAAANAGHTAAQRELGNLLFFTYGTNAARREAIPLWQQAARNGDGRAQYILGILYFNGDVVPRDKVMGYAWTLLAIDGGVPEALQSNTAMKSQLNPEEMGLALQRAGTLMTGFPAQGHYALLVGEPQPHQRNLIPVAKAEQPVDETPLPLQVAEAEPEMEPKPDPEPGIEQEAIVELPGEFLREDGTETDPEQLPLMEAGDEEPEPEPVVEVEETEPTEAEIIDDEPVEVKVAEPELIPEDEYDLGDPLSPLVDVISFEGSWSIQLTSFRKPENAETHWQEVLADYPVLFDGVEKRILRFDLGPERGVYYRLRIGPFEAKDLADEKCQAIKDAGLDCLVIWP